MTRGTPFEKSAAKEKQIQTFLKELDVTEKSGGRDAIVISTRLAEALLAQEKNDEAGELLWYALECSMKTQGKRDLMTVYCTGNLARFYHLRKECDIAELLYERAIQLSGRTFRFGPPGTLQIVENYIQFLKESGKDLQAAELEKNLETLKGLTH